MSQRTKVVGARTPILWLLIAISLIVIAALAVGGLVVYPQMQKQQAEQARLIEVERHYQAGVAFQNVSDWVAAEGEYKQVIVLDANYKDAQSRLAEVKTKLTPTASPIPPGPTPTATREPCREWNLVSDFQVWPKQENPNRDSCGNSAVWYFLGSATLNRDPQTYSLLSNFHPDLEGIFGLQGWRGAALHPEIFINTTGTTQHPAGTVTSLPNTVIVHPAPTQLVVVGWRSPFNGNAAITGAVMDMDPNGGDGILWYIDKGGVNLVSGSLDNGGAQDFRNDAGGNRLASVAINQGEFIYFIVHPRTGYGWDSTRLDITIQTAR